ncbi:MAG: uracil-DNA glycosylase [Rhodospirillales bacterium]|nr:uracil-DNA glycosylase [Rhodospirillales bacterium]
MQHSAAIAALQFYVDHGVDIALGDEAFNRFVQTKPEQTVSPEMPQTPQVQTAKTTTPLPMGKNQARAEAVKLAKAASTLDELREAIAAFDEIGIKKTATNLVFCDGNPNAPIMLVGEAPGADEDRQGKPFVGVSGQLLDRILACIDLDRTQEDAQKAVYISNILNWRPPGNRTPAPAEVEVSLPFIERHIQLVRPKLLILCGGVSAKALLDRDESVSRLRKTWHDYLPVTPELREGAGPIPAIATYHPAYLLRTPAQKKAVWADMLSLQEKRRECGLL